MNFANNALGRCFHGKKIGILTKLVQKAFCEARRNLVYTNLPVSTIAYTLGFDDPAYFSRVYAAATGLSPRAFRAQLHGDEK